MNFHQRKQLRTKRFFSLYRRKLITCPACNGSGYYDSLPHHKCANCRGTGKSREHLVPHLTSSSGA